MALLRNPRHELFARTISDGHSATQAHRIAGFSVDRGNAGRLRHRDDVKARIAELTAQKTAAIEIATLTAAEKAGIDAFWVMRTLRRNCVMAARRGDTAASNRAAELIGKHIGLFVERKELQINFVDDSDAYLARLLEIVETPITIDAEPAPAQLDAEERPEAAYRAATERHPLPIRDTNDGIECGSDTETQADTTDIC